MTHWIKPKRSSKTKVHRVKSTLRKIESVLTVSFTSPIGGDDLGKVVGYFEPKVDKQKEEMKKRMFG